MKILVTGAGGSAASNFIDALRLEFPNIEIVGADASPYMLALANLEKKILIPKASDPSFIAKINEAIEEFNIDLIHCQPDPEVTTLGKNREQVKVPTFLPSNDALRIAGDKELFATALRKKQIPMPVTATGSNSPDFKKSVEELLKSFPKLWVRARTGAGSRASLPVSNVSQAISWIEWWISEKGMNWADFMVSEFLPGKEFALQTVWQNGQLIAAEARERVAYLYGFLSPSGQSSTPSIARSTQDSRVYDLGIKGILALDETPNGIYCADIKEDYEGNLKITEVNAGRFFTTSNFFAHAGVNMPAMVIKAALGEQLKPVGIATIPENLYWVRMVDMGFKLIKEEEFEKIRRI